MLIIPLHRAPTRANFPWVTLALILANLFVFAFLQAGDARVEQRALAYYAEQGLAEREFPAYREWLEAQADTAQRREMFDQASAAGVDAFAARLLQDDSRFLVELRADRVITPQDAGYAEWRAQRDEFDRMWNAAFGERWVLQLSQIDVGRMFGSMFLHGSVGHLLGNMLFLALLGLLVEGALGHRLFLMLYLLGGLGAAAFSLWWRWGESGGVLGASGAIAALMGAYCVLWGARKVRFFWWFFVVFDYVKAPALVLLPLWLGWELANLVWNGDARVAFDAHAGGIACGALLALGVRALGWERRDFLDEDEIADAAADDSAALAKAREHIGRLEVHAARALLEPLAQRRPDDLDVLVALYRCARCEAGMPRLVPAACAALGFVARTTIEVRAQKTVYDDFSRVSTAVLPLSGPQWIALLRRWPAIGAGSDAATELIRLIRAAPTDTAIAAAGLAVARDLRARDETVSAGQLLDVIASVGAASDEAAKARLLLADQPVAPAVDVPPSLSRKRR